MFKINQQSMKSQQGFTYAPSSEEQIESIQVFNLSLNNKTTLIVILIITALAHSACSQSSIKRPNEVPIVDVRNTKEREINLASHKHQDIEVYRTFFLGNGYKVRYYQNENGKLNYHEGTVVLEEVFDKAAYKWTSDTSVAVKLYNTVSRKENKFELFGYGPSSSMKDYSQ